MTKETMKKYAIKLMEEMKIFRPYIEGFKKENQVCLFEQFGGFWAFQYPELMEKIKEIEQEHGCMVYAITHNYTEFGELYSFLIISKYDEDMEYMLRMEGNKGFAFAYVWNKSDEQSSEFGTIGIQSFGGGIKRIG